MFPGFGFGVDVTVAELQPSVPPPEPAAGMVQRRARLNELLPAGGFTDAELAREIQRAQQVEAIAAAYKAERIAQLATRRPVTADPGPDQPGATAERDEQLDPGILEFFPDELALILNCSRAAATVLCDQATTLLGRLPATWAALADGELDWPRARAIAAELGWNARNTPPCGDRRRGGRDTTPGRVIVCVGASSGGPQGAVVPGFFGRRRPARPGQTGRRHHRAADARRHVRTQHLLPSAGRGRDPRHRRRLRPPRPRRRRPPAAGAAAGRCPHRSRTPSLGHHPAAGHRPPDRDRPDPGPAAHGHHRCGAGADG